MTAKIPAILVCPNELLREGISRVLVGGRFDIVVAGPSIEAITPLAGSKRPVLAVLAVDKDGVQVWCLELFAKFPGIRVAVLADCLTRRHVDHMRSYGVGGFLDYTISRENLLKSLHLILDGMCVLPSLLIESDTAPGDKTSPDGENDTESERRPTNVECISARELLVLKGLTEGASNKVIARRLGITDATVKVHIKSIFRKTKMSNRVQLALWAARRMDPFPSHQPTVIELPEIHANPLPLS